MLSSYRYNYLTRMNVFDSDIASDIAPDIASDIASDITLVERLCEYVKLHGMTCKLRKMIAMFLNKEVIVDAKKTRKVRSKINTKSRLTSKNRKHHFAKTRKNIKKNNHGSRVNKTRKIKYIKYINTL